MCLAMLAYYIAIGIETIDKQQTNKQPQWLIKIHETQRQRA